MKRGYRKGVFGEGEKQWNEMKERKDGAGASFSHHLPSDVSVSRLLSRKTEVANVTKKSSKRGDIYLLTSGSTR